MAQIELKDLLTEDEISKVISIINKNGPGNIHNAREICTKVIEPNITRINRAVGMRCDPMYIAYAIDFQVGRWV